MTRDGYFEMCEVMGTVPKDDEIPVEFDDLITEVQECVVIYNSLRDSWEFVGGNYLGKDLSYIEAVFKMYQVPPDMYRWYLEIVLEIDKMRSKHIQETKPKT